MLGIVPAAGAAQRLQPLGFSKELLPLVNGADGAGRPRAVAEFIVERMLAAGADRVCLVIGPEKADLLRHFGRLPQSERFFFAVQPEPLGLCDAVFRAAPHVRSGELVLLGLPDTVWRPEDAFERVPTDNIHLITFPVAEPRHFDAVIADADGAVARIEVKSSGPAVRRVWGAITAPGKQFLALAECWRQRGARELYLGHLLNAWIAAGHRVTADRQGTAYLDLGTWEGFRAALAPARDRVAA